MMQCKNIFLLVVWIPFLFACSNDDSSSDEPVYLEAETRMNVSYGSHPQEVYDLYLPAGRTSETTKVVMLIHGGGWTSGDKADMNFLVTQLRLSHPDYAIVNVNYVLANENTYAFPHQFMDLRAIVQKLTDEKESLQIKPEFGMAGTSAGAHLAMMYDNKFDIQNQVKFVIDIVGPTNFEDPFYEDTFPLGGILWTLVDQSQYPLGTNFLYELSPVNHVGSHSSPTAMFYGTNDPLVPVANANDYKAKLDQFNISNTLKIYNGGHGNDWSQANYAEAWMIFGQYIDQYLP
jgi:acetyl esterase/lipase